MNEKILKIPELVSELDQRAQSLKNREIEIRNLVTVQDDKIQKLWKGYTQLGLLDHLDKEGVAPIMQGMFIEGYKKLLDLLNGLLNHFDSDLNNKDWRDETEKIIIDLFALFNIRWGSIFLYLKLWSDRRVEFRQTEINLMAKYKAILTITEDKALYISRTESIGMEHIGLIEKQLELITVEELLYDEMQFIYDERERLFNISCEVFLK